MAEESKKDLTDEETVETPDETESVEPDAKAEGTQGQQDTEENENAPGTEEDEASGEEENSGAEEGKKEGFFKKKKKDKRDEQIEELQDRLKRQMAEFDNFRKRTEKEKAQMFEIGAKSIIEKILPVVDNFERGLSAVPEDAKGDPFVEGMDKIYKQLMTELENLEVKPIEAVGTEFDPEFHNAVMQVESDEFESGVVAQELQKGYMYRDSVVRHSMVAVVQ